MSGVFSPKKFYLCPFYSQKRAILFGEHIANDVLLTLPHRISIRIKEGLLHGGEVEGQVWGMLFSFELDTLKVL